MAEIVIIPREVVDAVRERTNLVEVVKRHVDLTPADTDRWLGLCPFHVDQTPSFHVYEQRKFFRCLGCGEVGDVFTFLVKAEGCAFMEVLEDLARTAGVELPSQH